MLKRALVLLVALAAFSLAACSSEPDAPPRAADGVVADLAARVPAARPTVVFTAESDPNGLLGRPGGYSSAASFTDARVPAEYAAALTEGEVEAGGKVEVFADEAAAQRRADYITAISEQAPMVSEWTYVSGAAVVRVSRFLTEVQAREYEAALRG